MSIQALREQRGTIAAALKDLVAKPDWDAVTDQAIYDKAMADVDKIDAAIKRIQDSNAKIAEADLTASVDEAVEKNRRKGADVSQFARWLKGGDSAISAQEWMDIRNTMSTTTTTEGGYTVQTSVAANVIDYLKAYGGMRSVATVISTSMGNAMQFPTSDGTSETGEWIGQNTTATAADPVFGAVTVSVFKASSKIVAVPFELLQDSNVDIEAFVTKRLGERLGRINNTGYTTGNGTSAPNGAVTATSAGVTLGTGNTTSLTYTGIVDLIHSVDPAYRQGGTCVMMMNDATLKAARKVLDSSNRPIFVPGYDATSGGPANSAPDYLAGYRIVLNQDMAVPAANAKTILFGDFSKYLIRDVMDVTMFRFTDSAYTKLGQIGFLAWMRTGGNLLDTNAIKQLVQSAT